MKRVYIISGIAILVLFLGLALYLFSTNTPGTPFIRNNPFGNGGLTSTTTSPILEVVLDNGSSVVVPDFTKTDQPEIAGPETGYQVGGEVEGNFQILYFPQDSYFLVSLFAEPLGQNRKSAEEALRTKLQLTETDLCNLNINVFTTIEVSETYAGKDLGLSFCNGAVQIP